MRTSNLFRATGLLIGLTGVISAQVSLNKTPSREIGHPRLLTNSLAIDSANPNLVEGREFYSPQVIALDTSVSPPMLYVSDTLNNRVMAWRNASDFQYGQKADFVIGQKDHCSTIPLGPSSPVSTGLRSPTGLAVERDRSGALTGNLYVIDAGNNRILRFPRPYLQPIRDSGNAACPQQFEQLPDRVIGQASFSSSNGANVGGVSAKSLYLSSNGSPFTSNIAFDPLGNLWVTDAGNNRVLRYPASALAGNYPAADVVLGQLDFVTATPPPFTNDATGVLSKNVLYLPGGLAFDSTGRLYVSDSHPFNRILVYNANLLFGTGAPAARIMGLPSAAPGQRQVPVPNEVQFLNPQSVFMIGDAPAVCDSANNRIMLFDAPGASFQNWPSDGSSPHARNVGPIGQFGFGQVKSNRDQQEPGASTLSNPSSAVASATELFVADSGNNRVLVFPISNLGQNASATRVLGQDQFFLRAPNLTEGREMQFVSQLGAAGGVLVDSTSDDVPHLYVADTWNNRVLGFRDARRLRPGDKADLVIGQPDYQRTLINYPTNDDNQPNAKGLDLPVGLALDSDGNLFVADSGNGRVVRFPRPFDPGRGDFPAADLVLGQSDFTTKVQDATSRTMRSPYGLAFAGQNGLLVSDPLLSRVMFFPGPASSFTSGMAATKVFGQPDFGAQPVPAGSDTNQMNAPKHIATDSDDRLYVADEGNARILIFDRAPFADTNPRAGTVLTGPSPGNGFNGVRGIFVSKATGEIWTSELQGRVLRFPRFDDLFLQNNAANLQMAANGSVALTLDAFGDLYLAEGTNRVSIYYPGLTAKNGANYISGRAVAPGTITYLESLGSKFGVDQITHDGTAWPTSLNDINVLVANAQAPIDWVYPDKITFLMPNGAPTSGSVEVQVVRESTGQILAVGQVDMAPASPALFTVNSAGFGQLTATNDDGTPNQRGSEISRGHVLSLFGTGAGFVSGAPPDGQPADAVPTDTKPRVFIGSAEVPADNVMYSGLAAGQVGVWQIDVKIPDTVAPGPSVVLFVQMRSIVSTQAGQLTTVAVKQ